MARHYFSSNPSRIHATVYGPETNITFRQIPIETLTPENERRLSSGSIRYQDTYSPYEWYVEPQDQPCGIIRPFSMVYIEDARRGYDFTGMTIIMEGVDLVRDEGLDCVRFQAWRAVGDGSSEDEGGLLLMPTILHVPLSRTNFYLLRGASRFAPLSLLRHMMQETFLMVRATETYQQPRLVNRVTLSNPVLIRVTAPPQIIYHDSEYSIGLSRHVETPTASIDIGYADDDNTQTSSEDSVVSEAIPEIVLDLDLTHTREWEMGPARADTARAYWSDETTSLLSDGTGTTIFESMESEEETLGSIIAELEAVELRWENSFLNLNSREEHRESWELENLSAIVFATNMTRTVTTGPHYDVDGYLIEEEDNMVIGNLLD